MVSYTDKTLMPFGKYKGKALVNVPAEYLLWLRAQNCNNAALVAYIDANIIDVLKSQTKTAKFNRR